MGKYTFTQKDGHCPSCSAFGRRWFIQDRFISGNKYEYCLMSVTEDKPMKLSFKNKKEFAKWLNEDNSDAELDESTVDYIISRHINCRFDYSDKAMLTCRGNNYIYDKKKNTLTAVVERKQETGWMDSYFECLNMSKEIIKSQNGQMSLFI